MEDGGERRRRNKENEQVNGHADAGMKEGVYRREGKGGSTGGMRDRIECTSKTIITRIWMQMKRKNDRQKHTLENCGSVRNINAKKRS